MNEWGWVAGFGKSGAEYWMLGASVLDAGYLAVCMYAE